MAEEVLTKKDKFVLPDRKIKVQLVKRKGDWLEDINADHDGLGLFSGSKYTLCLPYDVNRRQYIDPLTKDEREYLESLASGLGLSAGDLSVLKKENNFWHTFEIVMTKDGITLDLNSPMDYIRYKVLLANEDQVAPSPDQASDKATYKWMLVEERYEIAKNTRIADRRLKAYAIFAEMQNSIEKMKEFLIVYGKRPDGNPDRELLTAEIDKIITDNLDEFLRITGDPAFDIKLFINQALKVHAITRLGRTGYQLQGGDKIAETMDELINYLNDKQNQKVYALIKAKIDTAK